MGGTLKGEGLQVRNLWTKYEGGKEWILKGVNFEATPGEFIVVGGKSGSGKTTLARCLLGLFPSFYDGEVKGEIDVFGRDPFEGPNNVFGTVGFVSQQPKYYTVAVSVREELILPLENLGLSRKEILTRVENTSERLKIEDLLEEPTTEISAGELQKVAIASALSMKPKVLVLDEPMARLDRHSMIVVAQILKKLAEEKITIIIFEHHLDEVLPLADRIFMLKNGKMRELTSSKDLLQLFQEVDLPEISETFLNLRKQEKVKEVPITTERAIEILKERV